MNEDRRYKNRPLGARTDPCINKTPKNKNGLYMNGPLKDQRPPTSPGRPSRDAEEEEGELISTT